MLDISITYKCKGESNNDSPFLFYKSEKYAYKA